MSNFAKIWGFIQLVSLFFGVGCLFIFTGPVPFWLGPLLVFGAWGTVIWFAWLVYGERIFI